LEDLMAENPQQIAMMLAANVMEPFQGHKNVVAGELAILHAALSALNRHAVLTGEGESYHYVEKLQLDGPTKDASLFLDAMRVAEKKPSMAELEAVTKIQRHEYGGLVFGSGPPVLPRAPTPSNTKAFNRQSPLVYVNEQARRLIDIGTGRISYTPVVRKKAVEKEFLFQNEKKDGPSKPFGEPIVYPADRASFSCMVCAGFIKRKESAGLPYGRAQRRVQNYSDFDMVCFFSRMAEAFGGSSNHVRYLMKDSLACTMAMKHSLRSRAAAYKKLKILREYPVPNNKRPKRFRIDQPIPFQFTCARVVKKKSSCVKEDDLDDERHPGLSDKGGKKKKGKLARMR
jgi:hypothetical protein